jgi:flagellar FliL protein
VAQAITKQSDDAPAAAMSTADFVKAALVALLLGGAGGGAFGYFVMPDGSATATKETSETVAPKTSSSTTGRFPDDALEIQVPSIIVDLDGEPRKKIRLDLSLIAAHGTSQTGSLKNEVREDVIAYLKGLKVTDIQGVRGFQNLREQLDDRAKIRGRGAILGLLIGGLVIE